jgi:lipopolysaccharide transport system permease protein
MSTEQKTTAALKIDNIHTEQPAEQQLTINVKSSQKWLAWADFRQGMLGWRIWSMLAYQDIKLRYRRSTLGPFWITLSMAITVYSMGYLYAHLFHVELESYFPFLVAGMLSWSLISTTITDFTDGLTASETYIKQIKLPYTLYIHRIACRNIFIFFHNIIVIVPVLAIFHQYAKVNFCTLFLIPGLALIYINAIIYGLILAMIGARFRDVSQVIKSLVQVIFFITPIMWQPAILGDKHQFIVNLNPIYPFVEFVRAPLVGSLPSLHNFAYGALITLIGLFICTKMFVRYRSRIVYWL